jgi:uncharacterized repeat protein (TIGR03803 family)
MTRAFPRFVIASLCILAFSQSVLSAQTTTQSILYAFTGGSDGASPNPLIQGSDGNFYGTAVFGGNSLTTAPCEQGIGCGTIFRLTSSGGFTTLYEFSGGIDGAYPNQLIQGSDGNFYGTTILGNDSANCQDPSGNIIGCGTIFRITPSGTFTVLYSFTDGTDGAFPVSLIQGSDGNFYGTTAGITSYGYGSIFQLTPSGSLATLYWFSGGADGSLPLGLVQGSDGNFYGATQAGGGSFCVCGTIFSITSSGSLTTIYTFTGESDGGESVRRDDVSARQRNLVFSSGDRRTTFSDMGDSHSGPVADIVVNQGGGGGGGVRICQTCVSRGALAYASPLIEGINGNYYGAQRGVSGYTTVDGTIFDVSPSGAITTLYTFGAGGTLPGTIYPLTLGTDGNFYGEYSSTIFEITASGNYTTYFDLSATDAQYPNGALIQGADGKFYGPGDGGDTNDCNGNGCGTIYTLTALPPLAAPVRLSLSSSTIKLGGSVTLTWSVSNAFSTTMQQCYAFVQGGETSADNWTGLQVGSLTSGAYAGSATLTPSAPGTYIYALTCGGQESGFATLSVGTTTTTLTSSPNPSTFGQYVTFTAHVTSAFSGTPTGTVTFSDGPTILGTASLSGGVAKLSVLPLMGGTNSITASYSGDSNFNASLASLNQSVRLEGTKLSLSSNLNPATIGESVTFTAVITSQYGGQAVGTVSFNDGGVSLGVATVSGNIASLTTSALNIGSNSITAVYSGSASFAASKSAALAEIVNSSSSQADNETVLHSLTNSDGTYPFPGVLDKGGNLYTATQYGGAFGYGTVLEISSKGVSTVLYSFTGGSDGANPHAGLTMDASGNLYGTTFYGGAYGQGTVFEVSPAGSETVLHSFAGGVSDGSQPTAVLTRTSQGTIYGTAYYGGAYGYGIVFELSATGVETVLYSFTNGSDGGGPLSTVLLVGSGLYGTTYIGGAYGAGTVFRFDLNKKTLSTLYTFTGGTDGASPRDNLTRDSAGNLYGTTRFGGAYGEGTIYSLNSTNQESVLYSFTGGVDGAQPLSGVIRDSAGNLYGTTWQGGSGNGVVFRLSPAGSETVLYTFGGGTDGDLPEGGLTRDTSGNLYGNTYEGGAQGYGAVYKISPPKS